MRPSERSAALCAMCSAPTKKRVSRKLLRMRNALAGLLLSIVALNASAQTNAKAPAAPKVATHSADERAVLETELKFESESEKRGAEAWYDFADENVSKPGAAHNRDELRAVMAKSYAQR